MLCRMQIYFSFMEYILIFWLLSVIDGGSCSQIYQSRHRHFLDAYQTLSVGSGYSICYVTLCTLYLKLIHKNSL